MARVITISDEHSHSAGEDPDIVLRVDGDAVAWLPYGDTDEYVEQWVNARNMSSDRLNEGDLVVDITKYSPRSISQY